MEWLSLGLPYLPFEALGWEARPGPCVIDAGGSPARVLLANLAACALGIRPGMSLNAARVLGSIEVIARREDCERRALEALATWCGQFTPALSLSPPDGLLLEVGASLRLFGGAEPLLQCVREGVRALGYRPRLALAPTPLAATLFVRAGEEVCIRGGRSLIGPLSRLPLTDLQLDPKIEQSLAGMGLRCIGDCLRLPREGLTKRFGAGFVRLLDRALGREPDPRPWYTPPSRFERRLELPRQTAQTEALLFAAQRLLRELEGFLRAREGGVQRLTWSLAHPGASPTRFTLGCIEPGRDAERFGRLLRERLTRLVLPAPVQALVLIAGAILPVASVQGELLDSAKRTMRESGEALIERLRARLGEEAVRGLKLVADYRPECAFRFCSPGEASAAPAWARRPLWLLPAPRPLASRDGRPCLNGTLVFSGSRECIESGWWDGGIARDYFIATDARGVRWWVFRERNSGRWFLHGLFD